MESPPGPSASSPGATGIDGDHHARARARLVRRRRALYSISVVGIVVALGTLGFHWIANVDFVDAFYFECMLATGQGPPFPLGSDSAKIFASLMAFVSVGSVLTSVVFTLGPLFIRFWHEAVERVEREVRTVERDLEGRKRAP